MNTYMGTPKVFEIIKRGWENGQPKIITFYVEALEFEEAIDLAKRYGKINKKNEIIVGVKEIGEIAITSPIIQPETE